MSDWQAILAIDSDPWACKTYAANFPGVRVECGAVSDWIDRLPEADALLGGPPCQPYSTSGKGDGSADSRDGLPDFIAAVEKVRPRMFLMENVSGLLNERHARYIGNAVRLMEGLGYSVDIRELNAADYGVPQSRIRAWFWGMRSDLARAGNRRCWPRQTHSEHGGPGLWGESALPWTPASVAIGHGVSIRRVRGEGMASRHGTRRDHPSSEPSPTLVCQKGGGGNALYIIRDGKREPLTVEHRRILMSAPDDFAWPGGIGLSRQRLVLGNGWACRMASSLSAAFRAADPNSRTIIDLFCGGGLGACGWHGRYWKYEPAGPTARTVRTEVKS